MPADTRAPRSGFLGSMKLTASVDRSTIARSGTSRVIAVIEVVAPVDVEAAEATPRGVVFAIDVSTSMAGEPLAQVVRSTEWLIEQLGERDVAGLVSFSRGARVLVPAQALDRAHRSRLIGALRSMEVGGNTNVSAGIEAAVSAFGGNGMLGRLLGRADQTRRAVLLLSDGQPNAGLTDASALADLAGRSRDRATVTTLGYGQQHDDRVLSAIAEGGGGTYHFIPDPAVCGHQLTKALGSAGAAVVPKVEITLKPAPGVRIREVGPIAASGNTVALGDLRAGTRRLVIVDLEVTPGAAEEQPLLTVSARPGASACAVSVRLADEAGPVDPSVIHQVLLVCADGARTAARALADQRDFSGAARAVREVMEEIERAPGFSAESSPALFEAREQLLDDAQIYEQQPDEILYAAFRRNQRAELVQGGNAGAQAQNTLEKKLSGEVSGAVLIDSDGTVHPLRGDNVIGRSKTCEVVIQSSQISRQHASVFALEGDFFVCDLGSSNGVYVDNQRVEGAHRLVPGASIAIGDRTLRFMRR